MTDATTRTFKADRAIKLSNARGETLDLWVPLHSGCPLVAEGALQFRYSEEDALKVEAPAGDPHRGQRMFWDEHFSTGEGWVERIHDMTVRELIGRADRGGWMKPQ